MTKKKSKPSKIVHFSNPHSSIRYLVNRKKVKYVQVSFTSIDDENGKFLRKEYQLSIAFGNHGITVQCLTFEEASTITNDLGFGPIPGEKNND